MMESTELRQLQMQLLKMCNFTDEKTLEEMDNVLQKYFQNEVDIALDEFWKDKEMTEEMMHELENAHFRTSSNKYEKNMESTESTELRQLHMQLLKMCNFTDEKTLEEMSAALTKHIRDEVLREGEKVWKEKGMTNEMMHELKNAHFRVSSNKNVNNEMNTELENVHYKAS